MLKTIRVKRRGRLTTDLHSACGPPSGINRSHAMRYMRPIITYKRTIAASARPPRRYIAAARPCTGVPPGRRAWGVWRVGEALPKAGGLPSRRSRRSWLPGAEARPWSRRLLAASAPRGAASTVAEQRCSLQRCSADEQRWSAGYADDPAPDTSGHEDFCRMARGRGLLPYGGVLASRAQRL